jgi:hypothetical protein
VKVNTMILLFISQAPFAAAHSEPADIASTSSSGPARTTGSPSNAGATVSVTSVDSAAARGTGTGAIDISLGTSLASGKFGTSSRSTIWSTALGVRYAVDGLRLSASVPYMRLRSADTIFTGIDSTPVLVSTAPSGPRTTHRGLGDATLGASYTLPAAPSAVEIELSGRAKLPTASRSSGLSTRKADYSAGVQITKAIGRFAPFASGTYRILGDPAGFDLRNGFAASVGTSYIVSSNAVLLTSYHYARAASRLVGDSHELFAGASTRLPGSRLRLTGFVTHGLSDGAARTSGGVSLAFGFGRI